MANEHQVSERAKTAGYGSEEGSDLFDTIEVHISNDFPTAGIDACIQYHCSWFHHIPSNAGRTTRTDDKDIRISRNVRKVLRMGMADRHCCVLTDQCECNRLSADVASSNNDSITSCDGNVDRWIMRPIPETAPRIAALLKGEVDVITQLPPDQEERVAG